MTGLFAEKRKALRNVEESSAKADKLAYNQALLSTDMALTQAALEILPQEETALAEAEQYWISKPTKESLGILLNARQSLKDAQDFVADLKSFRKEYFGVARNSRDVGVSVEE